MASNDNSNGQKDFKPDDESDSISPLSGDVNLVSKNYDGSNTDNGKSNIKHGDVPTPVPNDETENIEKIAAFVMKVLRNEIFPYDKMEWPSCLLIQSERSVEISEEELKKMILKKHAEFMATHGQSLIAKELLNIAECKRVQRLYYKKYKELLKHVNAVKTEFELLNRVPDNEVELDRSIEIDVNTPKKRKKTL